MILPRPAGRWQHSGMIGERQDKFFWAGVLCIAIGIGVAAWLVSGFFVSSPARNQASQSTATE
jgi:hypothetical protein